MSHTAWLVDLDGTLYRPRPVQLAMGAELLLRAPGSIGLLQKFRAEHERLRECPPQDESRSPLDEQLVRAARQANVSVQELSTLVEEWMLRRPLRWIRRFPRSGLIAEIGAFRAGGGKVGIVSDYPARRKLSALGLEELADVVVAAGEPGGPMRIKPAPDGYRSAAERLGVPPELCLVIGDRQDADGEAARRAGMAFRLV